MDMQSSSNYGSQFSTSSGKQRTDEYFTGASRRRITAMMDSGMSREEAQTKERERYRLYKEQQVRIAELAATNISLDAIDPAFTFTRFTGASKRRIFAMMKTGMSKEEAETRERDRYVLYKEQQTRDANKAAKRSNSATVNDCASKKSRHSSTNESHESHVVDSTTPDSHNYTVAIIHALHPEFTLTDEEIRKIKAALMAKLDRLADNVLHPQFVTNAQRNGFLSVTCNNYESYKWIKTVGGNLQPWPQARLKVVNESDEIVSPTMYICVTNVLSDENLSREKFLQRIQKQNPGIKTNAWRVLRMDKDRNDSYLVTFEVDKNSIAQLEKVSCDIFLNLSRIHIEIKGVKGKTHAVESQNTNHGECSRNTHQSNEYSFDEERLREWNEFMARNRERHLH